MAYRAPQYSYVHAARDVGAAAITLSHAADADFPVDNLVDDRAGTLFKFGASQSNPTIIVDLDPTSSGSWETGINRLIIPANHNINTLLVQESTTVGFGSSTTLHASDGSPTPGTLYDSGEFSDNDSTLQFIRVAFIGTDTFYLPQLCLTKIVTLDVGPVLSDAPDFKRANVTRLVQPTGLSPTIQHGADQRYLEYEYQYALSDAGASTDLTDIEALVDSVGMYRPFFVDPASFSTPPETDEPALAMKFVEMPESRLAVDVPMSGTRSKTYLLRLIESLD